MIETLASHGADDAFRVCVLPRGAWSGEDLMDAHSDRRLSDPRERVITIANEIPRGLVPRKRLTELLGGPRRRGMSGDRHVHDAATVMRQNDQHEEESTRGGGHDEEIGGGDLADNDSSETSATSVKAVVGARACTSQRSPDSRGSPVSGVGREFAARPTTGWLPSSCESTGGRPEECSVDPRGVGSSTSRRAGSRDDAT
jgi:hypothetical protein